MNFFGVPLGQLGTVREATVRFVRGVSFQLAADSRVASWKLTPLVLRMALTRLRIPLSTAPGFRSVSFGRKAWNTPINRPPNGHQCAIVSRTPNLTVAFVRIVTTGALACREHRHVLRRTAARLRDLVLVATHS